MVNVLFATNRQRISSDPLSPFGSGEVADENKLYCGIATVEAID